MVTERFIELVIGRLVTDEDFRRAFRDDPQAAVDALPQRGAPLTDSERPPFSPQTSRSGSAWPNRWTPGCKKPA